MGLKDSVVGACTCLKLNCEVSRSFTVEGESINTVQIESVNIFYCNHATKRRTCRDNMNCLYYQNQ